MKFINSLVHAIKGNMDSALAERIAWWEDEKSRCEEELVNARIRDDHISAKDWEKEADFCKNRIEILRKNQE